MSDSLSPADRRILERASKADASLATIRRGLLIAETTTAFRRAQARRQLIAIAHDLLPKAAGLARKGRPRLLAICARIIADEKLKAANPVE